MKLYRFLYSLGLCLVAATMTHTQQSRPARVGVYQPITGIEAKLAQERYWQEVARRAKELNFNVSPEAALLNPTTWANDFIVIYAQPDLHVSDYSLAQRKIDEAGIAQALTEVKTARNNKELAAATYNAIVERLAKKKLSPNISNLFNKSIMQPVIESVRKDVIAARGERRDERRARKESLAKAAEHAVKIAPIATESAEPFILDVAETATDVPDKYDLPELAIRQAGKTALEESAEQNKALTEPVRKEYEEGLSWFDTRGFGSETPAEESAKKEHLVLIEPSSEEAKKAFALENLITGGQLSSVVALKALLTSESISDYVSKRDRLVSDVSFVQDLMSQRLAKNLIDTPFVEKTHMKNKRLHYHWPAIPDEQRNNIESLWQPVYEELYDVLCNNAPMDRGAGQKIQKLYRAMYSL